MNDVVQRELLGAIGDGTAAAIRRRHVIYVSGYDPRGAQGYFDMFRRTCERSQRLWPVSFTVQPIEIDSEDFAHWRLDARGANWQVATHYDFLRQEAFIRADMAQPTATQVLQALAWLFDDVVSGALFRIFRASWRFELHLLCFHLLSLAWVAAAAAVATIIGGTLADYFGWPVWAAVASSLVAAGLVIVALRPLADRWRVIQITQSWTNLRRFGRGRPTWYDAAIDVGARRVLAVAAANEVDEVAVIGHSSGCVIALAMMARALELDPGLGRRGPRFVLLTLGSLMPGVALHPAAQRMRDIVGQIATAPAVAWIDCQSRKDVMCFANFDPVKGIGVDVTSNRSNPILWRISFRDAIAPENYNSFRRNLFRVHYQYIRGADRRAPYDYTLLLGAPVAMTEWPQRAQDLALAFGSGTSVVTA
jgi:pimeloyl-ACP methyl ester carboxylesterase